MSITNATYTSPDWTGFKYPSSLAPLPDSMYRGLMVLCGFSLLSTIACLTLLSYITYLFIMGGADYRAAVRKNQYVILIYSVIIADLQVAIGFLLSAKWLHDDQMYAPSSACLAQAWLTRGGDIASGLSVLAIAAHTFLAVVFGRRLGHFAFCSVVVGLWIFYVILAAVPIALHPVDIFVVGGNWCAINPEYDTLRLYFHYMWIFLAEFLVLFLYAMTFTVLRHRIGGIMSNFSIAKNSASSQKKTTKRKISLAALYMILYPVVYIIVTLPLAAGRIATMAGNKPSLNYLLVGACFMTSGGWINCLLYTFTRRAFLDSTSSTVIEVPSRCQRSGSMSCPNEKDGDIELSADVRGPISRYREIRSRAGSSDNITTDTEDLVTTSNGSGVRVETTWEVMVDSVDSDNDVDRLCHGAARTAA